MGTICGGFLGLFNASVTQIWFKRRFHIQKQSLECGGQLTLSSIWSKTISFGQKTTPTEYMVEKSYHLSRYLGPLGPISCPRDPNRVKNRFPYVKMIVGTWRSTHVIFNLVKKSLFLVKNVTERIFFLNEKNEKK